ncbi:MAG: ABC transporter ATP-binding protein [Blautia sp.]
MLEIKDLKKSYGSFQLHCSLAVEEGCITGLIGSNGAGKSTTFKSILGLIRKDSGTVTLFGKDVHHLTRQDKENIGVVLSDSGFSNQLTLMDIAAVLDAMYKNLKKSEFLEACRRYQLPVNKKIKEFSTGMKAKVKILAAISHKPQFLLLDEPTAGLDVLAREDLLNVLRDYMEEDETRSILISSHISTDLEGLCDDLYMIDKGQIILHEDTDTLLGRYGLLKVTKEQYETIETQYLLRKRKESYGYSILTNEKQFYLENYPQITVENGSIDEVIAMMVKGEAL